ncbi:unnamed protein product [Sphagnum troendelagicum]
MAQLRMKWKRKWAAAEQEEEGNEHDDDAEESLESGEESEPASQRAAGNTALRAFACWARARRTAFTDWGPSNVLLGTSF